ncbi:MAG TPA: alpha/beta hydrolase-fold protein [Gemmatirosa sp.]|nr:alpha/beta hydrolase-fold protein [Gemmatirosa sp.]
MPHRRLTPRAVPRLPRLARRQLVEPGAMAVLRDVHSPELHNHRDVFVYLPPSYMAPEARGTRWPVLYMHDGQNLFDPELSFSGAWRVDLAMQTAARVGFECIVVGVSNLGGARLDEYSAWFDESVGGGGAADLYVDFLLNTLKPMVDAQFRTRPEREATGVLGSSMGGLASLYAFFREPHAFGFCGAMSPAIWYARKAVLPFVEAAIPPTGRLWLDVGTGEGVRTVANVRLLRELLHAKGFVEPHGGEPGGPHLLRTVVAPGAAHTEAAWGRRLKKAIPWLLGA